MLIAPLEALVKIVTALGFEIKIDDTGAKRLVHTETGKVLKAVWTAETIEDLAHFKGVNGELEIATALLQEIWDAVTTDKPEPEKDPA